MASNFTEKDSKQLVELLNFIAEKGEFKMNTKEVIRYFGLLSWAQQELLPKVQSHILEVVKLEEVNKPKGKGK